MIHKIIQDGREKQIHFSDVINDLQKVALYETKSRYYLIGSNHSQTKFRVLKIDRTEPRELVITDDKVEYSHRQVKEILSMINEGNKSQSGQWQQSGLTRTVSAFGIVGFVRFLEGYYIILITKRRKVAVIGHHSIYKVEDTRMIYIPNDSARRAHRDEVKYLKLFQHIDLSSNFYFSYSYDLTHSLQYNMSPPKDVPLDVLTKVKPPPPQDMDKAEMFINSSVSSSNISSASECFEIKQVPSDFKKPEAMKTPSWRSSSASSCSKESTGSEKTSENFYFGVRNKPEEKFVWNSYLLEPVQNSIHPAWIIPITHGFVAQSNISVYGRAIFLTLIARRSNRYAGTRFLKRGANFEGDCANDVETEQIVFDSHVSSFKHGRFTSFVQTRGSVPSHWSQESKMVPKPVITLDVSDPYAETAGKHFNQLLKRFGSPIIILNLVKRVEKKPHESTLYKEYSRIISQLNITIPHQHRLQHIAVDMAHLNKQKRNVMSHLSNIAFKTLKKTGFFQSAPPYYAHHINPNKYYREIERNSTQGNPNFGSGCDIRPWEMTGRLQTGVVRVNCVDCLDRTNTAQFSLGKCALAFQLYTLGILEKPFLEFDTDCVRMLEEMYEDHGDTLALQYGGSQLVHRIKTYRHTAPWTSQGNDIMQTLSRYYSNTFSDTDKQHGINLFLGVYRPRQHKVHIWDLFSDYNLHHSLSRGDKPCHSRSKTQWWDSEVMDVLPLPLDEESKKSALIIPVQPRDAKVDMFREYHKPNELTSFSELFTYHMVHSVSPFSIRLRQGKRPEKLSTRTTANGLSPVKNPNRTGQQYSVTSETSSESAGSGDDNFSDNSTSSQEETASRITEGSQYIFNDFFPPSHLSYGILTKEPSRLDMKIFKRFASIAQATSRPVPKPSHDEMIRGKKSGPLPLKLKSSFNHNISEPSVFHVPRRSREIYTDYVRRPIDGPKPPVNKDLLLYQRYVNFSGFDHSEFETARYSYAM